jgi:hypothetical protein
MPELFSYKTVDMQQFQIVRHNDVEAKSAPVARKDAFMFWSGFSHVKNPRVF